MTSKNKTIVKEYIEKVINTGKTDTIEQFISTEYVEIYNNKTYPIGIEGVKEHIIGVRKTYPDLKLSVNLQIAEGDWVATYYTMKGTHAGVWMNIRPTGRKIEVTGVNIDKVVDGKITEHSGAVNMFEGLLGIGAIELINI